MIFGMRADVPKCTGHCLKHEIMLIRWKIQRGVAIIPFFTISIDDVKCAVYRPLAQTC